MELRGVEFGNVFNSSGARGFFGEGWWFHWIWKILFFFGFKPEKLTFKSKTATWLARDGNMSKSWFKKIFPNCVVVKPLHQSALNAIGLTNIGLRALLDKDIWQQRKKPFVISVIFLLINMILRDLFGA